MYSVVDVDVQDILINVFIIIILVLAAHDVFVVDIVGFIVVNILIIPVCMIVGMF